MVLRLVLLLCLIGSGAVAETRSITVGAPAGAFADLVGQIGRGFEAQSGTKVRVLPLSTPDLVRMARSGDAAIVLLPDRIHARTEGPVGPERTKVFTSDVVLVGSKVDRARIRGLENAQKAARWIAAAHALYVSSSPQFGVRRLEQRIWDDVGVNVRARPSWYVDIDGDETAVAEKAASFGAYALIERATWAGMRNRKGLEVIASGDPLLRTDWSSVLVSPGTPGAREWQDWLASGSGREAIGAASLDGVSPLTPIELERHGLPTGGQAHPRSGG